MWLLTLWCSVVQWWLLFFSASALVTHLQTTTTKQVHRVLRETACFSKLLVEMRHPMVDDTSDQQWGGGES